MNNCHPVTVLGCLPDAAGKIYTRCLHCGYVFGPHFPLESREYSSSELSELGLYRECSRPDSPRVPLPLPSLPARAATYIKSWIKHKAAGTPLATPEQILERFRHCSACERYNDAEGACSACGCFVNLVHGGKAPNKLEWADAACPLPVPVWGKIES